jgi:hypothetical protein
LPCGRARCDTRPDRSATAGRQVRTEQRGRARVTRPRLHTDLQDRRGSPDSRRASIRRITESTPATPIHSREGLTIANQSNAVDASTSAEWRLATGGDWCRQHRSDVGGTVRAHASLSPPWWASTHGQSRVEHNLTPGAHSGAGCDASAEFTRVVSPPAQSTVSRTAGHTLSPVTRAFHLDSELPAGDSGARPLSLSPVECHVETGGTEQTILHRRGLRSPPHSSGKSPDSQRETSHLRNRLGDDSSNLALGANAPLSTTRAARLEIVHTLPANRSRANTEINTPISSNPLGEHPTMRCRDC